MREFSPIALAPGLLNRLAEWCERREIDEVYGSVVQSDLRKTPSLLDWYEKRGFDVWQPSDECLPNAVKMVVWRRRASIVVGE